MTNPFEMSKPPAAIRSGMKASRSWYRSNRGLSPSYGGSIGSVTATTGMFLRVRAAQLIEGSKMGIEHAAQASTTASAGRILLTASTSSRA